MYGQFWVLYGTIKLTFQRGEKTKCAKNFSKAMDFDWINERIESNWNYLTLDDFSNDEQSESERETKENNVMKRIPPNIFNTFNSKLFQR